MKDVVGSGRKGSGRVKNPLLMLNNEEKSQEDIKG